MNRAIIDIQDITVLLEEAHVKEPTVDRCVFDEPVIGVAFYGEGNVSLEVCFQDNKKKYQHTKGLALSFYADQDVVFEHCVAPAQALQCLVIVTSLQQLKKLSTVEQDLFHEFLQALVSPSHSYVEGPRLAMTPAMQQSLSQIFSSNYDGKAKVLYFKSQVHVLLAHFFGQLSLPSQASIHPKEKEKLFLAQQILQERMEQPPSLNELSRLIGLNSHKLKKEFKNLFGLPVFKYLQQERLTKAHDILAKGQESIREVAWQVGYDSLSSFSNAFVKHFGFRPSEVKNQSLSNKS